MPLSSVYTEVMYLNFTAAPLKGTCRKSTETSIPAIIKKILLKLLIILLSSALYVALDAQFIGGTESQHSRIVSCPASSVTAQTSHRQVFISYVNKFFPNRVG
jgi:hypothetical protein